MNWETKRVRAYNLKPGDVVEFLDTKKAKTVKRTVQDVVTSPEVEGNVVIKFRSYRWALHVERMMLVRTRRLNRMKK
jgi:hypothetical protein